MANPDMCDHMALLGRNEISWNNAHRYTEKTFDPILSHIYFQTCTSIGEKVCDISLPYF